MEIISVTMPIFIFVIMGYMGKSFGIISEQNMKFMSKISYYFALPALLLKGIISFDFETVFSPELVIHNLSVTFIVCVLSIVLALVLVKPYQRGAFSMSCFRSNQGYIGLPLALGFYGEQSMSKVAITLGFSSPFVTILSIMTLDFLTSCKQSLQNKEPVHKIFTKVVSLLINPYILVTFFGLTLSYFQIPINKLDFFMKFLEMSGNMALPLALLSVGYSLELQYLNKNIELVIGAGVVKLILMPFIAFLLAYYVFRFQGDLLGVSVLLPATPTSVASYVMACEMDTDGELSAASIGFSTLASVFTLYIVQSFMLRYI
jgi:predicted permease